MGEQEGAALVLGKAALELPAHQRVQLGVLVDRSVDAGHEPLRFEHGEMVLEIQRRSIGLRRALARGGDVKHGLSLD